MLSLTLHSTFCGYNPFSDSEFAQCRGSATLQGMDGWR